MSQLARDEAGNVWEVDAQGNAVRLVQSAQAQASQPMTIGTPDPTAQYAAPKAAADLQSAQLRAQQAAATAPYDARKAAADAASAQDQALNAGTDRSFKRADALRGQYLALPSVKNYTQALPVYGAGLRSRADPAGDLNLIYAYAKVMDPNSVVREGEQASVAGGDAWVNAKAAELQKQLGQGGTFQPQYRRRLREEMANRMGELNQIFIADRVQFKQVADRNGVDPRDVVGDHPGARYQAISEQVLGRKQQQLDYNGMPLATGATKRQDNPELQSLADGLIRGGLPYEQVNTILRQNGASGDIDRKQFEDMRLALARGYAGQTADASREVPTSLANRFFSSPVGTAVGAGIDAALAGTSDEITALMNGESLAAADARKQAAFDANPTASTIGQLAGTIGVIGGLGAAAGGTRLASAFSNPALATDIIYGGLSGAGQNNDARLTGAAGGAIGSAIGNVAGGLAVRPIGALARTQPGLKAVNAARGLFGRVPGVPAMPPIAGADALTAAQRAALGGVESAKVPDVVASLTEAQANNLPFTLADTSPNLGELAGGAVRRSPVARNLAENVLMGRSRSQIDRLGAAVEQRLGPIGNTLEQSKALRDQAQAAAKPLYDAAYAVPGRTSDELLSLANTPFGREGMAKARTIAANERRDPNKMGFDLNDQGEVVLTSVPSMQTIDLAKRGMDDVLERYRNPVSNRLELSDAGRAQNLVKNQFLAEADKLVPEYGAARKAYQGPMESLDALQRGKDFYGSNIGPNQVNAAVAGQTPEHLAQMQLGYRDAMMNQANGVRFQTNPWDATLGTPNAEAKLSAMYPGSDAPQALFRMRDLERQMAQTNTRVIGGSQTAGRQIADQQFLPSPIMTAGLDAATVATGGVPIATAGRAAAGSRMGQALRERVDARSVRKAEELAPILLNADPAANLALVNDLVAKSAAYQRFVEETTPKRLGGMFGAALGQRGGSSYVGM